VWFSVRSQARPDVFPDFKLHRIVYAARAKFLAIDFRPGVLRAENQKQKIWQRVPVSRFDVSGAKRKTRNNLQEPTPVDTRFRL